MCVCVCVWGCVESPYVVRQNYLGTACVCVCVCVCVLCVCVGVGVGGWACAAGATRDPGPRTTSSLFSSFKK